MRLQKKCTANFYTQICQRGGGITPFRGNVASGRYMRGGGFGSIFKDIFKGGKAVMPYITRAVKSKVGKSLVKSAVEKIPVLMAKKQTVRGAAADLASGVSAQLLTQKKKKPGKKSSTKKKTKKQKGGTRRNVTMNIVKNNKSSWKI